jgi:lipid A 3-O-deacylase
MRLKLNATMSWNSTQIKSSRCLRINLLYIRIIQGVPFILAFLLAIKSTVAAPDGISLGIGKGNHSIKVLKGGLRKHFNHHWFDSGTGRLTGYWELSLGYWDEKPDNIFALGLSPVFVYEFRPMASGRQFYINAGIGVAVISDTRIGTRNLGSTFQFEDQIGLGLRFGNNRQHDLNLGFLHYSNARIKPPNDGIDILLLTYTHWFEHHR